MIYHWKTYEFHFKRIFNFQHYVAYASYLYWRKDYRMYLRETVGTCEKITRLDAFSTLMIQSYSKYVHFRLSLTWYERIAKKFLHSPIVIFLKTMLPNSMLLNDNK